MCDRAAVPWQGEDLDAVLWKMVSVGELQSQGFTQTDQAPQQPSKRGECPAPNGPRPTADLKEAMASRGWAWGGGCSGLGWRMLMTWGERCLWFGVEGAHGVD